MYHCRFETTDPDIQTCDCQTRCLSTGKRIPATREWFEDFGLSVRTSNILHNERIDSPEELLAMDDVDILRIKNAGRRVLAELRARGLRRDSCRPGCVLSVGHAGPCSMYDSRFSRAPVRPEPRASVSPHDVGAMLLWSLRYAMGRRSTAPLDVAECIQRYWSLSDDAHRWFMFRDLRREFERAFLCGDHARLGDRCDVETWAGLLFWMRDRVPV